MKREILFRAKSVSSGNWVYGNYIHSKRFSGCSNEYRIHEQDSGIESDIDQESVGQFTGLKDKNGTKIFENDIVSFKRGIGNWSEKTMTTNHVVSWDDTVSRFSLGTEKESIKFRSHSRYEYEVLGNIFDNPEILEAAN